MEGSKTQECCRTIIHSKTATCIVPLLELKELVPMALQSLYTLLTVPTVMARFNMASGVPVSRFEIEWKTQVIRQCHDLTKTRKAN